MIRSEALNKSRKKWEGQKGQGAVEFALIIPLFCMVALLLTDIGRFIYVKHIMDTATRAGARAGAAEIDSQDALNKARDTTTNLLNQSCGGSCSNFTVMAQIVPVGGSSTVQVSSNYNFEPLTWISFFPSTIASRTSMYKEG